MLMQVLTIIQQSFLYSQAFRYGGETSAAIMAVSLRIQAFSFIPLWGMSQGLQPAIGANFGAKQYNRVKKYLMFLLLVPLYWQLVFGYRQKDLLNRFLIYLDYLMKHYF